MSLIVKYEDVLKAAKNLASDDLERLLEELGRDVQKSRLNAILSSFKTNELSEKEISVVCESVRTEIYEGRKAADQSNN